MRVPTVRLKNRKTGKTVTVNQSDYALGSVPGINIGSDWDVIGETRGDGNEDEAIAAAQKQRRLVEKQAPKGAAMDAKVKKHAPEIATTPAKGKKTVAKKKVAKKKTVGKAAKK